MIIVSKAECCGKSVLHPVGRVSLLHIGSVHGEHHGGGTHQHGIRVFVLSPRRRQMGFVPGHGRGKHITACQLRHPLLLRITRLRSDCDMTLL